MCGVDSQLLIPRELVQEGNDWQNVDWWLAAFLLLEGWHERLWKLQHSPIHSYSFRLKGWDVRAWEHAWVNRIGLFLRAWAIQQSEDGDTGKLGPLPNTKIHMTHDVDAVAKTLPIRLKQGRSTFSMPCKVCGVDSSAKRPSGYARPTVSCSGRKTGGPSIGCRNGSQTAAFPPPTIFMLTPSPRPSSAGCLTPATTLHPQS